MSEKIQFTLEAVTKGTKDIVSTTTATERLTAAMEAQRGEVKSLNQQLRKVNGFQSAEARAAKLGEQIVSTKQKFEKLGQQLEDNKASTGRLRIEYSKTQQEVKSLNQQMQRAGSEGATELKQKLSAAEDKLSNLNHEIASGKQQTNELRSAYRKAGKSVEDVTAKQVKQRNKIRDLRSAMKEAGISTDRLGNEQKRLGALTEKANQALERQNKRLKEMQSIQGRIDGRKAKLGDLQGSMMSTAVAAAPLGASLWASIKNESSFANVKKVVDMSPEKASELKSWALKLSTTTTMDANQINQMLEAGGQSGLAKNGLGELKQFVEDSAKVGIAFDMSAEEAGGTMATFRAALGLDQKGAYELAGVVNTLSNKSDGKVNAKQIAEVMAREGATAKMAGFSLNDSAALASAFVASGMEADVAATAIKKVSGALTKGYAASGGQKKALNRLGYDSENVAAMMQSDASGTFIKILEAINSSPPEEQSALVSQLFGDEAVKGVSILSGNLKLFKNAQDHANKSLKVHIESLDKEYRDKLNTTGAGIELFKNRIARLAVIIGDTLKPHLDMIMNPLSNLVDGIGDWAEKNKGMTASISVVAAGVVGITAAFLGFKSLALLFGNASDKTRLFRKGLNRETKEGGKVAAFAAKQWRNLNSAVSSSRGPAGKKGRSGLGADYNSRAGSRSRRGRGIKGKLASVFSGSLMPGKKAGIAMAGGGLAMMPMAAMGQDVIDIGGELAEQTGKMGLAKVLKPLGLAINAVQATEGIVNGNMEQAGSALGDIGGSLAGAAAGAAIGSVVPIVGTAIGGVIGAIAGGFGGEALGGWFGRKLDSPEETAKKVNEVQLKEAEARQRGNVHFAPVFQVNGAPSQDPKEIAREAVQQMNQQYSYLMGGNTVSTRLGYAAIDQQ